ncbi:MAG: DUF4157 domain-containing protein [Bacteroidales bacterium]|nr:DUF4157 domain-containing protein [Bacteroidales bacterium]
MYKVLPLRQTSDKNTSLPVKPGESFPKNKPGISNQPEEIIDAPEAGVFEPGVPESRQPLERTTISASPIIPAPTLQMSPNPGGMAEMAVTSPDLVTDEEELQMQAVPSEKMAMAAGDGFLNNPTVQNLLPQHLTPSPNIDFKNNPGEISRKHAANTLSSNITKIEGQNNLQTIQLTPNGQDPDRYHQMYQNLELAPPRTNSSGEIVEETLSQQDEDNIIQQAVQQLTTMANLPESNDPVASLAEVQDQARAADALVRERFPQLGAPERNNYSSSVRLITPDTIDDNIKFQWIEGLLGQHTNIGDYNIREGGPNYNRIITRIIENKQYSEIIANGVIKDIAGFTNFTNAGPVININPEGDSNDRMQTVIHETVHYYSNTNYRNWIYQSANGRYFNEGFTEWLTRKVLEQEMEHLREEYEYYNSLHLSPGNIQQQLVQEKMDAITRRTSNNSSLAEINTLVAPFVSEDDIAMAFFQGEVWRIEGESRVARNLFERQIGLREGANRRTEITESESSRGIVQMFDPEVDAPGNPDYRFMNFAVGSHELKQEHIDFFNDEVIPYLDENPQYNLRFVGHASEPGTETENMALARLRSQAFYNLAQQSGIAPGRLIDSDNPPAEGELRPNAGNATVYGRAFNRRVELFLIEPANANSPAETETGEPELQEKEEPGADFFARGSNIQTKLIVGQPGDRYELEADKNAEIVVQDIHKNNISGINEPSIVQPETPEIEPVKVEHSQNTEKNSVQPSQDNFYKAGNVNIESDLQTTGAGMPIPENTKAQMENAFGADFSDVRLHTNSHAVDMNRKLNARAFTHGSDIYFNSGNFNTTDTEGQRLLAHELTHTIQQGHSVVQNTIQRDGPEESTEGNSIRRELSETRQALADIHHELSTGLFDWRINETEARNVFNIMRGLQPPVLLRVIQALRLTDRAQRFYNALSEADRQSFDEFARVFATDTGYISVGDTIELEVYATSREPRPEFTLDLNIEPSGIRPFFVNESIPVAHLLPGEAAERIAAAYRRQQVFVEPRIRLRVSERSSAYSPRDGITRGRVWFEAVERISSAEQTMIDKRQQFLDYIQHVDISDDPVLINASITYLNWVGANYNTEEFLERQPGELWRWSLEHATAPLPESPVQPFLELYRHMNNRLNTAPESERPVLSAALNRYLDWIDQHIEDTNISNYDPVEIWLSLYSQSFDQHLTDLQETSYRRYVEQQRQIQSEQERASRQAHWEEYFSYAMRLWGESSRTYPYRIPIPGEGRDILVTGHEERQQVLNRLAEELMNWATDHMFSPEFLSTSPASVLVDLLESGYSQQLDQAAVEPVQSESIDRHEIIPGRLLESFGETLATGLCVIAIIGIAVGAGIITAVAAAIILAGIAVYSGIQSYLTRREEIEQLDLDIPIPLTILHSIGDAVGLSQLIEGITGERLGTGSRLSSIERSESAGTGSGSVVLLLTGSKVYRNAQLRGQRARLSSRGSTPAGPEGAEIPNPQATPPVDISRPLAFENPGPLESALRQSLSQDIRVGFDMWMAEIRSNGGNPETVLNRIPANRRNGIVQRRVQDFAQQYTDRVQSEIIRIRSMDNPLNPMMRHTEQAIPGNNGVLVMYNHRPPAQHEIAQAIRLFRRTGEPIRLFGDTASGRSYPGIDGTIGYPPRPLSLKHGNMQAGPNFARFQAEEALIKARSNGYSHVEVHIEMEGCTTSAIRAAWEAPPLRPGQTAPRPVFDSGGTVAKIVVQGTDSTWVIEPPLTGRALPGIPVTSGQEENERQER